MNFYNDLHYTFILLNCTIYIVRVIAFIVYIIYDSYSLHYSHYTNAVLTLDMMISVRNCRAGDSISYESETSCIHIAYRKAIQRTSRIEREQSPACKLRSLATPLATYFRRIPPLRANYPSTTFNARQRLQRVSTRPYPDNPASFITTGEVYAHASSADLSRPFRPGP